MEFSSDRFKKLAGLLKEGDDSWSTRVPDDREIRAAELSDIYKEKHGIRPRHYDFDRMSLEDIENEIQELQNSAGTIDWDIELDPPETDNFYNDLEKNNDINRDYSALGQDDEYDLMPKHAGMKKEGILGEDWDNYQSLEEIETKYLQQLMLAIGLSTSDDRLPQVQQIFNTALKDAEMLGKVKSGTPEI